MVDKTKNIMDNFIDRQTDRQTSLLVLGYHWKVVIA